MGGDDFSEWAAARWPRLVRSAVLLGCTSIEAEDLVQATFERCLLNWAKVQRADDRDAYVHRVLVNGFTSARRRRWVGEEPTAVMPEGVVDDVSTGVDDNDVVMRALSRLGTEQRAVVVLRYYAHLSEQQTAAALDIAPGTVKSRMSRALKVLAKDSTLAELRGTP